MAEDGQGYSAGNLDFVIKVVGDETNNSLSRMNSNLKVSAFSLTKLINKVYFLRNYTKQMFRSLKTALQNAIDYTETLNLWQVAMRENRQEAEEFVNTMNKAYGISTQTLMNYQAIFRNMLSSLGGVSSNVSYQLSEFLTQMALDYASLYNTSIAKAMQTFQAVLSGQVRPIRSIAGYDITETTIFQLYQQLGGTKTMRQLSQTEKRLLRIYAVFQQMENSGAIGDLGKTLESSANQLRIFTESTKELGTWLGITLEMYIKPILPYLNAVVITLTNITKAIAKMQGYIAPEYGVESIEQINEALDETQGKLLSFDRFEALNSSEGNNILGIDENLLAGLSKYDSILNSVTGKAQELAEAWTSWWVDADTGKLTEQAQKLLDVVSALGIALGGIIALNLISKIGKLLGAVTGLTSAGKLLNLVIATGVVYSFMKAIELFKDGDTAGGILATTLGVVLVGAFIALKFQMLQVNGLGKLFATMLLNATLAAGSLWGGIQMLVGGFIGLTAAVAGAFALITNWGQMETWQKIVGVLGVVTTAVLGLALAMGALHSAWSLGAAAVGIVAGIAAISAAVSDVKTDIQTPVAYKTGGFIEDGVFTMNKNEMAGTFDDGTTVVANNMQISAGIENASYRGLSRAMRDIGYGGNQGDVYLDKKKVGIITASPSNKEMIRTGLLKVNK